MRKWTCVFLALFLVGSLSSMALAQQKQIKLKAVQFVNMGNPSEKPFHYFVDSVNKQAKGALSRETNSVTGDSWELPVDLAGSHRPWWCGCPHRVLRLSGRQRPAEEHRASAVRAPPADPADHERVSQA